MEPIVQRRKRQPTALDPVRLWATIVEQIRQLDGTGPDTFINTVRIKGCLHKFSAADVRAHIKQAVRDLNNQGLDLQITPHDVGLRRCWPTEVSRRRKSCSTADGKDTFMKYICEDITTTDITTKISNVHNFNLRRLI